MSARTELCAACRQEGPNMCCCEYGYGLLILAEAGRDDVDDLRQGRERPTAGSVISARQAFEALRIVLERYLDRALRIQNWLPAREAARLLAATSALVNIEQHRQPHFVRDFTQYVGLGRARLERRPYVECPEADVPASSLTHLNSTQP